MRQIFKYAVIILTVLLVCGWAINPPEKKLRLGKDLRGGVSLIYTVQVGENERAEELIPKTIDAIKRRLDPDGVKDITIVKQGNDRIELTLPLPDDGVKQLRREFDEALAELGRNALNESRLEQAMRLAGQERDAALTALAAQSQSAAKVLQEAAAAYDLASAKRAEYERVMADPAATEAAKDAIVSELASAEIAYDQVKTRVLSTAINPDEIRVVTSASRVHPTIDDKDGRIQLPSPREEAERRLREAHPDPDSQKKIDDLLAKHEAYSSQSTGFDDPQEVIRMLRGAGVLSFRITVQPTQFDPARESLLRRELAEVGPRSTTDTEARWFKINKIEGWIRSKAEAEFLSQSPDNAAPFFRNRGYIGAEHKGSYYMLCWDTRNTQLKLGEGAGAVSRAFRTSDEVGRPAIGFEMNPRGAVLLGALTGQHVQHQMAVLLDDEIYTAPTLQSPISSNGRITGTFSYEEIDYVVRVLGGGSLQAKLSRDPISISSVGPELGTDNLRMGLVSAFYSAIVVIGFMLVYYFGNGMIAVICLAANSLMILGAMSLSHAAFTMPGIAGVILTFGMAVDSNVLVFERMREELLKGADLKRAVRIGYDKALSAIIDGNVTNLIVCVVLYYTGSAEIRGFAITMGIGVVSTLFACLVISRFLFDVLIAMGLRRSSMLPVAVPYVQKFLTPSINWLRLRYIFFAISLGYMVMGFGFIAFQGSKMLDNEFLGGTQVTIQLKADPSAPEGSDTRLTMARPDVAAAVTAIGKQAPDGSQLRLLNTAEVFPINPQQDGVTSDRFTIKTLATDADAVTQAIVAAFSDKLETKPPLDFAGAEIQDVRRAPVYDFDRATLGDNIDQPAIRDNMPEYIGGVAVIMADLDPPPTLLALRERLDMMRESQDFADTLGRVRDVRVIEGTENAVRTAVLVVVDPEVSRARRTEEVAQREWNLVREALTSSSTPASVHNFSPAIAATFQANAIAASVLSFIFIGIYIWIRFKTPRYALAAVVAVVHDVVTVLGLIALAELLYEHDATHDFAVAIGLLPFKIDLNLIAAMLTIAGYSLNDTVVIMDRIRENRGKNPYASAQIINDSVNQTFSRTLITGGTTMISCLILYIYGGEGMRAFAFALFAGLVVGTYSSVAVAAPIVWSRKQQSSFDGVAAAPATY
jgi:SecD/SecF fusion protein